MAGGTFQLGDRVRARISTPYVQVGTLGTIRMVYHRLADTYEVQFDGYLYTWLMHGRDLERVDDESGPAP
jgi:hypothetical protein